jgi:hypothetical protein
MALSTVEQVVALLAAAYETRSGQAVPFDYGHLARAQHNVLPHVYFIPAKSGGKIDPPPDQGNRKNTSDIVHGVKSHVCRVECWANDRADTESLHEQFLATMRESMGPPQFSLGAWGWAEADPAKTGVNAQGELIWQMVTFYSDVIGTPAELFTVTGYETSGTFGDTAGCIGSGALS